MYKDLNPLLKGKATFEENAPEKKDPGKLPSGHMTFMQHRLNVDATSWRCIDVEATLYRRHVSAGCTARCKFAQNRINSKSVNNTFKDFKTVNKGAAISNI